jgi:hypothetical protein
MSEKRKRSPSASFHASGARFVCHARRFACSGRDAKIRAATEKLLRSMGHAVEDEAASEEEMIEEKDDHAKAAVCFDSCGMRSVSAA